jgi:hypothetical protein
MARPPVHRVSQAELRQRFNHLGCDARIASGDLVPMLISESVATHDWLPAGTKSQMVAYYERDATKVAEVHQYLCPDGTLGASGMPDPKYVYADGVIYKMDLPRP